MPHMTRRSILSTAAASIPAAVLPMVVNASAATDAQILAAIEAHRRAYAAPDWQDDLDDEEIGALADVMNAAQDALLALTPATAAGALAVLRYARELADRAQYGLFPAEDFELPYPLLDWAERAISALGAERQ